MLTRFFAVLTGTEHREFLLRMLCGLLAVELLLYVITSTFSPSLSLNTQILLLDDERWPHHVSINHQPHRHWNLRLVRKWRQHLDAAKPDSEDGPTADEVVKEDLGVPCPATPPDLVGQVKVWLPKDSASRNKILETYSSHLTAFDDSANFEWQQLFDRHRDANMSDSGHYRPPQCRARQKVAIIIPYRNRDEHLRIFVNHMVPILKRQQRDFKIYLAEQAGNDEKFNRGTLMNVGYVEALREYDWQCVIFHDVDLLPENDKHIYACTDYLQPIRLSGYIDKLHYKVPYAENLGGAEAFPVDTFRDINGFSNRYWGWGGEDDDLSARLKMKGYHIVQPDEKNARYKMIKHVQNTDFATDRVDLLKHVNTSMVSDGLSTLTYRLKTKTKMSLFTHLLIEIHRSS